MAKITLAQAALWCGGRVEEQYKNITFCGASNDSRTITPGQLFVALVGVRDGNDFAPMAFQNGAAAILTSRPDTGYPAIVVEDSRIALGEIAAALRQHIGMKVVGVTGSVGKSTTKEMIAAVLEGDYIVSKTPANFNNDLGLPMALLAMEEDTQIAVLEMGMSHFGEISYLSHIAKPDIAVITNIGTMHMENLGSRQGILQAKLEICDGMAADGQLCLPGDDPYLWGAREYISLPVTWFGAANALCQVQASAVRQQDGLSFTVQTGEKEFSVTLPLEGEHFVSDALSAICVGLALQVSPDRMASRLARFRNMAGRQEIFEAKGLTIINDAYNAGPESMAAALKVLGNRSGRRIAVLGDMLELGTCTPDAHHDVGVLAAQYADILLSYGPNSVFMRQGALDGGMKEENALAFTDRQQLVLKLRQLSAPGDVLLFKGSRGMRMELAMVQFLED
jgi:UDP-N-acetylmuramoyl-tripeptide--D-alanyl-D-alanine ligase